jgi:hypothetical protein
MWEAARKGGDYRYKGPLVTKGIAQNLKQQNFADIILAILLKAPWAILKHLTESFDPNVSFAKRILDAGRFFAEIGISGVETGFSIAEQVGIAAEIAKEMAVATGSWNLMEEEEKAGIDASIEFLQSIPPHPKRKEVYDEIRFYLKNIPTATVSIPIWIGLWIWPTTFGIVYLVGDAIEKGIAIYEHNQKDDDPTTGKFSADTAKAKQRLASEMLKHRVDLNSYKDIGKPFPKDDDKKKETKEEKQKTPPKPKDGPCD